MKSTADWWNRKVNWNTPAGRLLQEFSTSLPQGPVVPLTLFGSAALQLTIDETLLSADVDVFSDDNDLLESLVKTNGFDSSRSGLYLEPCFELSFRSTPKWPQRATKELLGRLQITIPHPLDILISKLGRFSPKDVEAWKRVVTITGHPTVGELKNELQLAVDLFSPSFDESMPNRYIPNTEELWRTIYQSTINVRNEIIEPALKKRRQGYGPPPADYKSLLF